MVPGLSEAGAGGDDSSAAFCFPLVLLWLCGCLCPFGRFEYVTNSYTTPPRFHQRSGGADVSMAQHCQTAQKARSAAIPAPDVEYAPRGPKTPENAPCGPQWACWGRPWVPEIKVPLKKLPLRRQRSQVLMAPPIGDTPQQWCPRCLNVLRARREATALARSTVQAIADVISNLVLTQSARQSCRTSRTSGQARTRTSRTRGGRHPGPPPQGAQPAGPRTARGWGQAGPGGQTATRHGARPGSNTGAGKGYAVQG